MSSDRVGDSPRRALKTWTLKAPSSRSDCPVQRQAPLMQGKPSARTVISLWIESTPPPGLVCIPRRCCFPLKMRSLLHVRSPTPHAGTRKRWRSDGCHHEDALHERLRGGVTELIKKGVPSRAMGLSYEHLISLCWLAFTRLLAV